MEHPVEMASTSNNSAHDSEMLPREVSRVQDHIAQPENVLSEKKQDTGVRAVEVARTDSSFSEGAVSTEDPTSIKARFRRLSSISKVISAVRGSEVRENTEEGVKFSTHTRAWRTSIIRFGPLSGIACMLLAIASIVSSLGILAGSDGQPTKNWATSPPTYLAIFTALANLSIRYAAIQGVVIAWWFRATEGSTLAKLHWDWRSGTTLRGALTAGRHTGLLALACIFSTLVVIDGPLLQKASKVVSAPIVDQTVALNVSMAAEIPSGLFGVWWTSAQMGYAGAYVSPSWNRTVETPNGRAPNNIWGIEGLDRTPTGDWQAGAPLRGVVRGCPESPGTCKVHIQAPALFKTACSTQSIELHTNREVTFDWNSANIGAPPLYNELFVIDVVLRVDEEEEMINMVTAYADTHGECDGTLHMTTCSLKSGIGLYEFEVSSDQDISIDNVAPPVLVALANNTAVNHTVEPTINGQRSTLGNVVFIGYSDWSVQYYVYPDEDGGYGGNIAGPGHWESYATSRELGECLTFRDPQDDLLRSLNKVMLYSGAHAATLDESYVKSLMDPDLPIHYPTTGYLKGDHNVFQTNYYYFLAAAIVELVCIAFVAPTYWGWWKIGRPVSFSPLEMAKAFKSPLLVEYNSNSSGRDLANATEDVDTRYGLVYPGEEGEKRQLAFGQPATVESPEKGTRFEV